MIKEDRKSYFFPRKKVESFFTEFPTITQFDGYNDLVISDNNNENNFFRRDYCYYHS